MQFHVLGPLQALADGVPIPLGGVNQRAALGALLLHANSVVATRHLVRALWGDEPPSTARKMLHNAISGLRGLLAAHQPSATLQTHAPGYLLRVAPDDLDRLRFERLAARGHTAAKAGDWGPAAQDLRAALDLWRGPAALSDLVDSGIDWPEIAGLSNARLAVLEDYVEVQLAVGRHAMVIRELELAVARTDPPRERLCHQLMLALYRCGRQADALSVYRRTRADLAEKLGLDPSRELRDLEYAILAHDPGLAAPERPAPEWPAERPGPERPAERSTLERPAERSTLERPAERPAVERPAAGWPTVERPIVGDPARRGLAPGTKQPPPGTERKRISVLQMAVPSAGLAGTEDTERLDELCAALGVVFRDEAERVGGVVQNGAMIGLRWRALFGIPRTGEDDAERAVRAGLAIRDRLGPELATTPAVHAHGFPHLAVVTGEALAITEPERDDPSDTAIAGSLLDERLRVLERDAADGVHVCDETWHAAGHAFRPAAATAGRVVLGPRSGPAASAVALPHLEREREMATLDALVEQVRGRGWTHLVTVVGEWGIGKSRLVEEFAARLAPDDVLVSRVPRVGDTVRGPLADILAAYLAAGDDDEPLTRRLRDRVHDLAPNSEMASWMEMNLRLLLDPAHARSTVRDHRDVYAAWWTLIEAAATRRPLVLVLEDLHRADDVLLDFVEEIVDNAGQVPLLLVATARADLLQRRPQWTTARVNRTTVALEPLSDRAVGALLDHLSPAPPPDAGPAAAERAALIRRVGGIPRFAVEFVRMCRDQRTDENRPGVATIAAYTSQSLPHPVRNAIAARLDTLPVLDRAILRDVAVLGEAAEAGAVAAVGGHDLATVERCMEDLARRDFLVRSAVRAATGAPLYDFRQVLVREVAYAQLPRSVRARKHYQAAVWIENGAADERRERLAHHYDHALSLSVDFGLPQVEMSMRARRILGATLPAGGTTP